MTVLARATWLALLVLFCDNVLADWAGFNRYAAIAEMRIDGGRIAVNLRLTEKGFESLTKLPGVDSDAGGRPEDSALGLLVVRNRDGKPLGPKRQSFRRVEAEPQSTMPVTDPYYEVDWDYPIEKDIGALTIEPRPTLVPNELGLIVLDRGVPVSDLVVLDKPLKLSLDPADPWHSYYGDASLIRRHAEPRSYVYVEPYEVRHEMLIRLADLVPYFDAGLRNPGLVTADERPALKQKIGSYLLGKNPLSVNSAQLKPLLDHVEFVGFSRAGMVPVAEDQPLDVAAALVGAVIVYLTEQPTQNVNLRWELFGSVPGDRAVSLILGKESFDGYMTKAEPGFEWSRDEALAPLPVAAENTDSEPVAQSAHLSDEQLRALLQSLLHNAYRAFQLREEEAVYDRLGKSLEDPLLEDIYLQQRRAQLQQAKGLGGEGRVERIEVLDVKRIPTPVSGPWNLLSRIALNARATTLDVEVRWKAQGEVSHWGHSHKRENLYAAWLSLHQDTAGDWKIVAMHFLDGQRLDMVGQP